MTKPERTDALNEASRRIWTMPDAVRRDDLLHWADYYTVGSHGTDDNPCERCDRVRAELRQPEGDA